jgi:hypothetical protein
MKIIPCFWIIFSVACSGKEKGIPEGVIPPAKMKVIVWDMIKAEQYALEQEDSTILKGSIKDKTTELYQQVFEIHQIDKNTFYKSFGYYEGRPDLLKALLDSISVYANTSRGKLFNRFRKPPLKPEEEE